MVDSGDKETLEQLGSLTVGQSEPLATPFKLLRLLEKGDEEYDGRRSDASVLMWYICVLTAMCACAHVWRAEVNRRYYSSGAI